MAEKTLGQVGYEAYWTKLPNTWDSQADYQKEFYESLAQATIQAYEARRWRAIESAPKDGTPIFAWFDGLEFATAVRYQPGDDLSDYVSMWDHSAMAENPTHWTPIPAPPKEASDAGK